MTLQLKQVELLRQSKTLLKDASITIKNGNKLGLIGANGCGKSSLFSAILGNLSCVQGAIDFPKHWRIAYLKQETPALRQAAIDYVLAGDLRLQQIENNIQQAEQDNNGEALAHLYGQYEEAGGYSARARAAELLAGLEFSTEEQEKPVKNFSGGWRMRLNLAQALMAPADLLLLDEPTNHLDLDAIMWLEKWLQQFSGTLLLISHDRDFLDNVVNHIAQIYQQKIKLYAGDYSSFEEQWAKQLELEQKFFAKQEKKRAHLQSFIDRFKAKATKAKQAQSRVKMLQKMEKVAVTRVFSPFHFRFPAPDSIPNPLLTLDDVSLGYEERTVLKNINLQIQSGQRLALLGPNGAGKSTLIKGIGQQLLPQDGKIIASNKIKIGYFAQHQLEQLPLKETPLQFMQDMSPSSNERELRTYLGSFSFSQDMALQTIGSLSGGEKARLVLAELVWQKPNLILLDEPTNHLDMDMRAALTDALHEYKGTVILITHDRHLMRSVCEDLILVADGLVQYFNGDIDDYIKWFEQYSVTNNQPKPKQGKNIAKTELSKKIKIIEQAISKKTKALQKVDSILMGRAIYEDKSKQEELIKLQIEQNKLNQAIQLLEKDWLDLHDQLDHD